MTDQLDTEAVEETADEVRQGVNRRRMFLAGAGLAGVAVVTKAGTASAADPNDVTLNEVKQATTATGVLNNGSNDGTPGTPGNEALYGEIDQDDNGSHAVRGITAGTGHAIAGETNNIANTVGATWGRHRGPGPGVDGVNVSTETIPLAGDGNGVRGTITEPTNGSHAVKGVTMGAGHSVAGDTPADAEDGSGGPNTTAATWGRHQGVGAGIGGISVSGYGGEFVGGKASVRLIPSTGVADGPPADDMHAVGELFVDGRGDLYYNPVEGANFTRLNNQGGTVILPDTQRAYDSREEYPDPANPNKGRHTADEVREIDLTEFTDLPASAQGAIINLTVAETDALGFALVYNGDTEDTPLGSSINWVDAGEFIANGITVAVSATGTVKVYTLVPTEIIIDVVGYIS
jgi:hypothetical protein